MSISESPKELEIRLYQYKASIRRHSARRLAYLCDLQKVPEPISRARHCGQCTPSIIPIIIVFELISPRTCFLRLPFWEKWHWQICWAPFFTLFFCKEKIIECLSQSLCEGGGDFMSNTLRKPQWQGAPNDSIMRPPDNKGRCWIPQKPEKVGAYSATFARYSQPGPKLLHRKELEVCIRRGNDMRNIRGTVHPRTWRCLPYVRGVWGLRWELRRVKVP